MELGVTVIYHLTDLEQVTELLLGSASSYVKSTKCN